MFHWKLKKKNLNDFECNYRDAVFAIGTRVVGLKLAINAEEIDEDRIPVYDWYTQVFARDDRDDTKKEESRIWQQLFGLRARYFQSNMISFGCTEFKYQKILVVQFVHLVSILKLCALKRRLTHSLKVKEIFKRNSKIFPTMMRHIQWFLPFCFVIRRKTLKPSWKSHVMNIMKV